MTEPTIPAAEYETRRDAFELCRWIDGWYQTLDARGDLSACYFERHDRSVKRLIEEAVPVSRLAVHLSSPGNTVYVTFPDRDEHRDAILEIPRGAPGMLSVEVTCAESENATLLRQKLARDGMTPLTGRVSRAGREITVESKMIEMRSEYERLIGLMLARLREKLESGRYPAGTAFLVYLTEFRRLPLRQRSELVDRAQEYLWTRGLRGEERVYFTYLFDNVIDDVVSHAH